MSCLGKSWRPARGASSASAARARARHSVCARMRLTSLTAVGRDVGRLAKEIAAQARAAKPSALLWITDAHSQSGELATALS